MATIFPPTSRIVTATFTVDDVPDDPDVVTAHFRHADDAPTTLVYNTDPELVRVSVGVYEFEVDCTEPGVWRAKITGQWDDEPHGPTFKSFEQAWVAAVTRFPDEA